MGWPVRGTATVSKKKDPFTPNDDKTGKAGNRTFYGVELGYVGGKVAVKCKSKEDFEALKLGDELEVVVGVETEGGKTGVTLERYKVLKQAQAA